MSVDDLTAKAHLDGSVFEAILAAEHPTYIDEIYLLAGALGIGPGELLETEEPGGA